MYSKLKALTTRIVTLPKRYNENFNCFSRQIFLVARKKVGFSSRTSLAFNVPKRFNYLTHVYPSGLGDYFIYKRFAVQTLLWSLEFIIHLEHGTFTVLQLSVKILPDNFCIGFFSSFTYVIS